MKRLSLFGAALAGLAACALAAPAHAAPAAPDFSARARAAGYTATQAAGLQRQADHYRQVYGGRQVAINEVDFPGGVVLVPLPGEKTAHRLGTVVPAADAHGCGYATMCLWEQAGFQGATVITMGPCKKIPMPWGTVGSWVNAQTPGTQGTFYHKYPKGEGVWGKTGNPLAVQPSANWAPVSSVRNCG